MVLPPSQPDTGHGRDRLFAEGHRRSIVARDSHRTERRAARCFSTGGPLPTPASMTAGISFGVAVATEDRFGSLVRSYNGGVAVVLGVDASGGTLYGTVTVLGLCDRHSLPRGLRHQERRANKALQLAPGKRSQECSCNAQSSRNSRCSLCSARKPESVSRREELVMLCALAYHENKRQRSERQERRIAVGVGTRPMIQTVVVGHGLAGRAFHCPLIRRQPELNCTGSWPAIRRSAPRRSSCGRCKATPASTRRWTIPRSSSWCWPRRTTRMPSWPCGRSMPAGTAWSTRSWPSPPTRRTAMIAARDRSGRMLSVFHNRRWDWDFVTIKNVLAQGLIGRPLLIESSVCRHSAPRTWRGRAEEAGTILHDWGAHLVDHALQLGLGPCRRLVAWVLESPWEGVDSGGHGRIVMEFDQAIFQAETSRICRIDRPRWWIVGTEGGFVKSGIDPQEDALRAGDIDRASGAGKPPGNSPARPAGERSSSRASPRSAPTGTATTPTSPATSCTGSRWP